MGNQQSKLSFVMGGLQCSGKSTILSALPRGVRAPGGPPGASGFNILTVSYNNYVITIWDSGGHYSWSSYQGADAIIFVVDAADHDQFANAKEEISQLMDHLSDIPVLIYANKQDLSNAVDEETLKKELELDKIKGREWFIQPSCAKKSKGIFDGLDWLIQEHIKRKLKDVDIENKKTAEKYHLKALERAMKEKGTLEQDLVHGVLIGVPRSGKSSLMTRLLGEGITPDCPSTGVVNKVVQVDVKKSATTSMVTTSRSQTKWVRIISYNEEALTYGAMVLTTSNTQAEASPFSRRRFTDQDLSLASKGSDQSSPSTSRKVTRKRFQSTPLTAQKSHTSFGKKIVQLIRSKSVELPEGYKATIEIFKEAFKVCDKSIEDFQKDLENSWSLYLTDTGGQIEFQELLPLLVSSPSIFFLVFRLDRNIDDLFTIEYLHPTNGSAEPYRSTLTTKEALMQSLVSIASMRSFVFKGDLKQVEPKVFFVATHKDKLDSETAEEQIKAIDDKLKQIVMSTTLYGQDIVQFASRERLAFTVNNLSKEDTDFEEIRSAVERIVARGEFKSSLPTSWLFYSLALRRLKGRIISYEDAKFVAEQNGITTLEELEEVLQFLHSKLGLVRYFPEVEALKDIVVLDPQLLFDKVTDLIINTFTFKNFGKRVTTEFEKKGIFPENVIAQVSKEEDQLLTPEQLIKLLEKLRIIALYQNKVEPHEYFIPCALAHTGDIPKCQEQIRSDVPPLVITFSCGFVPKGVSGALIVFLLQNEIKSDFEIQLDADTIYKNQLSFSVGPHGDLVTLRIDATHFTVSVELKRLPGDQVLCTIDEICAEIRSSVKEGIVSILKALPYAKDIVHSLTFFCPKCNVECHPAEMKTFKGTLVGIRCSKTKEICNLPDGYEKWLPEYKKQVTCTPSRQSMPNISSQQYSAIYSAPDEAQDSCDGNLNIPVSVKRQSSPVILRRPGSDGHVSDQALTRKDSDNVFSQSASGPDASVPISFQLSHMSSTSSETYSHHNSESYFSESDTDLDIQVDSQMVQELCKKEEVRHTASITTIPEAEDAVKLSNTPPSLQQAFRTLIPIAHEWKNIAALLGLPDNLGDVLQEEQTKVNDRLRSMLSKWLNQVDPKPSWSALAQAVEDLGHHTKAKAIRDKYFVKE